MSCSLGIDNLNVVVVLEANGAELSVAMKVELLDHYSMHKLEFEKMPVLTFCFPSFILHDFPHQEMVYYGSALGIDIVNRDTVDEGCTRKDQVISTSLVLALGETIG